MPFEKGREKTGGRKPGVGNKTTQEIRDAIQLVLSKRIEELDADLDNMSEFKKWTLLNNVTKYVLPALAKNEDSIEHSGGIKITVNYADSEPDAFSDNDEEVES
jgi:hypothetical protein